MNASIRNHGSPCTGKKKGYPELFQSFGDHNEYKHYCGICLTCLSPPKHQLGQLFLRTEWKKKVSPEGQVFKGEGKRVLCFLAD